MVGKLGILIWIKMDEGGGGGGKERTGCGNDVTHQEDWTGLSVLDDGDSSDILIGLFIANSPLYQNGKEFIIILFRGIHLL